MPIVIVTEGDFAGINCDGSGYRFKLNAHNIGPFAAALPLSDLLDPKKENECIESLKAQFATLPLNKDTEKFLADNPNPIVAAHQHYEQMKIAALESDFKPSFQVSDAIRSSIEKGLASCPSWIADCAQANNLKIAILDDATQLEAFFPEARIENGTSVGFSTNEGLVYIKSAELNHCSTIKEEILHEVESKIFPIKGDLDNFADSPPFKNAIRKDIASGQHNFLYNFLISQLPNYFALDDDGKNNIGLPSSLKGADELPELLDYIYDNEALVDIYHIEAMVQAFAERKIKLGGVVGLDEGTTVDDVIRTAFPNTWPLLQGPREGKKLIQDSHGYVTEIDKEAPLPKRAVSVTSLREYCELQTEALNKAMAEHSLPLGKFSRNALKIQDISLSQHTPH